MIGRRAPLRPLVRIYRIAGIAFAGAIVSVAVAVAAPLALSGSPEFFSRYHLLERRYVNLERSAHDGIGCRSCHETQPLENGAQIVADYYTSLFENSPVPRYFTFASPTNEACLACHRDDWSDDAERTSRIPHPAHQRVAAETRECAGCHKWTAHFETYMPKHKEMPFSRTCVSYGCHVGTKTTEACYDCHHVLHESNEQWRTEHQVVARETGQNACLEGCHTVEQCQLCHTTGERPVFDGLPVEVGMQPIEDQHTRDDWTEKLHGREALKGRDRCLLCHQSEGECGECHLTRPEMHGSTISWIGRHKDVTKDKRDPACVECHEQEFCDDCHRQFEEME
ncbi:MAG: hypothetical protein EG823_08455 [Actinobacteria bacterium]|nr:hypothetical protein [Actinomycetota bacterium]